MARSRIDEYSKYNRLLRKLQVTPDKIRALPQITPYVTRSLKLPRDRVLELLRMSAEPEVVKFLEAYDSPIIPDEVRSNFNYEFYCAICGISPLRLLELLGAQIVRSGAQHSAIRAALRHPEVVEATITSALIIGSDGMHDRDTLHKAVGFLPQPKGAVTNINLQANAQAGSVAAALTSPPPPELTIRSLTDRFNEHMGLKEGAQAALPPAPVEEEELPTITEKPELIPAMTSAQRLAQRFEHGDD